MALRCVLRTLVLCLILGFWTGMDSLMVVSLAKARPNDARPTAEAVAITTPKGDTIWADVADTPQTRARGLMFRTHLPSDRGMLFIFTEPQHWTIWMKNTKIPLDIVWLDEKKTVVHIEPNVPICLRKDETCPQYQPNKKATYVLELAAGVAAALTLEKGTPLRFSLAKEK